MYESALRMAYELRLFGVHESLQRRCEYALSDSQHPADLLSLILQDEQLKRKSSAAKRLTTRARFRSQCDIQNWDDTQNRGISKAKLTELKSLSFIKKRESLIITGPTGVGKTHLAIALGSLCCQANYSVLFQSSSLLFEAVNAEKAAGRYLAFLEKLKKVKVLILDDFALKDLAHDEANTLLEILEERYEHGVNIVTSQVDPQGWKGLIQDPVLREAVVDRLTHPADLIKMKGDSFRKKKGVEV